jgi:amidase
VLNTGGSSSGAGTAANFWAANVGTETSGSILSPANQNMLVAIKPTVGRISRWGVIPISADQDTPGPMTRTVADAAALLAAMAGPDPRDPATARAEPPDSLRVLEARRLAGTRLGVVRNQFGGNDRVNAVIERSLAVLKAQGAVLVDPVELRHVEKYGDAELDVLLHELKAGLPKYLAEFAPDAPVRTLADVIAWNERHRAQEMPWFGQELFERAAAKGGLDSREYLEARALCARYSRAEGIDALLAEHRLDALVAPTGGPAWLTDLVNGDHYGGSFSTPAAVAGYPHLTVPAGFVHGLPVGLSFVGPAFSEPLLLGLGHAFEQATQARRPPTFAKTIPL